MTLNYYAVIVSLIGIGIYITIDIFPPYEIEIYNLIAKSFFLVFSFILFLLSIESKSTQKFGDVIRQ